MEKYKVLVLVPYLQERIVEVSGHNAKRIIKKATEEGKYTIVSDPYPYGEVAVHGYERIEETEADDH